MAEQRRPVQFRALLEILTRHEIDFVVVGGVAAVLEGAPVATFDLDIVYSLEERNLTRLVDALQAVDAAYVDLAGRSIRPSRERLRAGGHHLLRTRFGRLDVLGHVGSSLRYAQLVPRSVEREVQGIGVLVLGLEAVIETKESSGHEKDMAVLPLLRRTLAERGR